MSGPNGETLYVLREPPRGTAFHYVKCPQCNLGGWKSDDDHDPMPCPHCGVEAVRAAPPSP